MRDVPVAQCVIRRIRKGTLVLHYIRRERIVYNIYHSTVVVFVVEVNG